MGVLLYRVDDRLIHGQVVVGWGRFLKANAILVASDRAAADEMSKTMMEMGAGADVKVEVLPVADAAARLREKEYEKRATIVLFETPADALRFLDCGVDVKRLNIGGMHYREGKRQIMEAVSVDDDDCRDLRALAARGVALYVQMIPHAKPVKLWDKLPREK